MWCSAIRILRKQVQGRWHKEVTPKLQIGNDRIWIQGRIKGYLGCEKEHKGKVRINRNPNWIMDLEETSQKGVRRHTQRRNEKGQNSLGKDCNTEQSISLFYPMKCCTSASQCIKYTSNINLDVTINLDISMLFKKYKRLPHSFITFKEICLLTLQARWDEWHYRMGPFPDTRKKSITRAGQRKCVVNY